MYHHTSTLRTNLIWMSGVIDVEGSQQKVIYPHLGEIGTDVLLRRSMTDFPPVAWFTRRMEIGEEIAHGMSLNRAALGGAPDSHS